MKATGQLIEEHEGVMSMLKILEEICLRLENGGIPNIEELDSIIDFLKGFVDKCHHGKEEDILFPELELRGVSGEGGPIGVMLAEHEAGRTLIRSMSEALSQLKLLDQAESVNSAFLLLARKYIQLLREHIAKENQVLFNMADSLIDDNDQNELFEKFEELESERMGPGQHDAYHHLLETLAKTYLA